MKSRHGRILQARLDGLTYQQIGNLLGISRQRVHQLIRPTLELRRTIAGQQNGHCQICGIALNGGGHLHHIASGGDNYNSRDNLQLLCIPCHHGVHRKPSLPTGSCPICEKATYKQRKYCSPHCHFLATHTQLQCRTCGKIFYRQQSEALRRYRRPDLLYTTDNFFCSNQCQGVWAGNHYGWARRWAQRDRK